MISPATYQVEIDYSRIDPPLRALIKNINKCSWARTAGCCAGRAFHDEGYFYLLVMVNGLEGVKAFTRWLSLSRSLGWDECMEGKVISAYALPDAEMIGAAHDANWITFDLRFHLDSKQPDRKRTIGGIKALELGWDAVGKEAICRRIDN